MYKETWLIARKERPSLPLLELVIKRKRLRRAVTYDVTPLCDEGATYVRGVELILNLHTFHPETNKMLSPPHTGSLQRIRWRLRAVAQDHPQLVAYLKGEPTPPSSGKLACADLAAQIIATAQIAQTPFVLQIQGPGVQEVQPLNRARTVIGRSKSPKADITIKDARADARHCAIFWDDSLGHHYMEVWGGFGTVFNGEPLAMGISSRHILKEGDEWQIGETVIRYARAEEE